MRNYVIINKEMLMYIIASRLHYIIFKGQVVMLSLYPEEDNLTIILKTGEP